MSQALFYPWIGVLVRRVAQDGTPVLGPSANHRSRIYRCSILHRYRQGTEGCRLPRSSARPVGHEGDRGTRRRRLGIPNHRRRRRTSDCRSRWPQARLSCGEAAVPAWQARRSSSSEAALPTRSEAGPRSARAIRKKRPFARPHPCASTRRSNDTPLMSAHTGWPVVRPRRATESRVMRARRCCAGVPGRSSSTSA